MTSLEKIDVLLDLDKRKKKAKITTANGETYYCKPLHFAEDEKDWAYDFFTPDYPTKHFILECNFIDKIEEISEEEWQRHIAKI